MADQAFRQVQFGAGGVENTDARNFLKTAGGQLLPGDPTMGQSVGYLFYATPEQKVNAAMYLKDLLNSPETYAFYLQYQIKQPTVAQLAQAATADLNQRNLIHEATVKAAGIAGALALLPAIAGVGAEIAAFSKNPVSYCLANPQACVIGSELLVCAAAGPACPVNNPIKGFPRNVPGVDKAFRSPSAAYPANEVVIGKINSLKICAGDDCSETAEILKTTAGTGKILRVTGHNGKDLRLMEYGRVGEAEMKYHEVFSDGRYVYDPRLSTAAVPLGDWKMMIRALNPGALIK